MKKKVSLSQNFYLCCVYLPSCEAHKHCRAEIAQYRLELIFKSSSASLSKLLKLSSKKNQCAINKKAGCVGYCTEHGIAPLKLRNCHLTVNQVVQCRCTVHVVSQCEVHKGKLLLDDSRTHAQNISFS